MATPTAQERQREFAQNLQIVLDQLGKQYGFQLVAALQNDVLSIGAEVIKAVITVQPLPDWQPPPEKAKNGLSADLLHEAVSLNAAEASPVNGKH